MDFKDYQRASFKHLSTCQSIIDSIEFFAKAKNSTALITQETNLQPVLHNIFYLSGYTLETIVNYSIYKHFKWKKPSVMEVDYGFSNKCDLTFYQDIPRNPGTGKYLYWISQHNFQRNIHILAKAFPASKIPFIDRSVEVDKDVVKLFKNWSVEVRYHPEINQYDNIQLNADNVKKFVDTTSVIYNGLMKIVG